MYILGINAYHGDAAAAIVRDGRLIAAAEEERFNRFKHSAGFPEQAIRYCLREAGIGVEELEHVGISRDPSAHLHKKILFAATRVASLARSQIKDRLGNAAKVRDLKDELARVFGVPKKNLRARFHNIEHHRAHLASCFFVSPFERAALLSIGSVEFLGDVRPGDVIELDGRVESMNDEVAVLSGTATVDGTVVMEAKDIMCALIDAETLAPLDDTQRLQGVMWRE